MCLAVPVKIIALTGDEALVEADGVQRTVIVSLIKNPKIGETVLIHAGFAIQKWTEEDMREFQEIQSQRGDVKICDQ
ncbi:HypC/HybG/HupF family hydrogenase formation chaperone [bacterium]|nr:HypC/HybG/HupF family hydrogenase formation chaperone [bacterium]